MQIIYKYIVCILLFTCLGFTQDTLITKQGKQYIGKVIDSDSKSVKFSYPEWDSPKKFYLNSAEVFLEPKVPKSNPILKAYKNYKNNKKKLKKEKKLFLMEARRNSSFLIKEKAIYDAKHKARKWVLYPIFSSTLFIGGFSYLISVNHMDADIINGPTFGNILGGALCLTLPYFTLDAWDNNSETQLILHNYNDSEKEIYHSVYKKTFKRKKLLYSALGIPVAAGVGFILFMATFDLDFSGGAKLDGYQGS
jgi:hypothetical protein